MFSRTATRRYSTARTQKEHVGKIAKKSGMVWKDSRGGTMWKHKSDVEVNHGKWISDSW